MKFLEKMLTPGKGVTLTAAVIVLNICVGALALVFIVYEKFCNLIERLALSKLDAKYATIVKAGKIFFLYLLPLIIVAIATGYQVALMLLGCYGLYRLYSLGKGKTKRKFKWK